MTWLYIIAFFAWASVVLAIIGLGGTLVWLAIKAGCLVRRWYIGRRNEQLLRDHMLSRQGFRAAARRGWVKSFPGADE